MRGGYQTPTTKINGFSFVIDFSDLPEPPQLPLLLLCKGCQQLFGSDYEEKYCGNCVKRRELTHQTTTR